MNLRPRPRGISTTSFWFFQILYLHREYFYFNFNFIVDQLSFIIIMTCWASILTNRAEIVIDSFNIL